MLFCSYPRLNKLAQANSGFVYMNVIGHSQIRGNKMRIYITHCSAKKDNSLKNSGKQVTLCKLYTATPTQHFMTKCKRNIWVLAEMEDLI